MVKICNLEGYRHVKDYYYITLDGEVFSLKNRVIYKKKTRIKKGYYYVNMMLTTRKKDKEFRIHRIVATAFIPNPFKFPIVDHIDENKLNNHFTNLQWCTPSQNRMYSLGEMYRNQINVFDSYK